MGGGHTTMGGGSVPTETNNLKFEWKTVSNKRARFIQSIREQRSRETGTSLDFMSGYLIELKRTERAMN